MTTTVSLKQKIDSIINAKHLLKHPFYVAWTEGKLSKEQLRGYAEQYFHNVLAEPTYLSAVHFNTPHFHSETNSGDISVRQEVLKNLISEEHGEKNHPALWKNFALALGSSDKDLASDSFAGHGQAGIDIPRHLPEPAILCRSRRNACF